jgi:hypothetical protein
MYLAISAALDLFGLGGLAVATARYSTNADAFLLAVQELAGQDSSGLDVVNKAGGLMGSRPASRPGRPAWRLEPFACWPSAPSFSALGTAWGRQCKASLQDGQGPAGWWATVRSRRGLGVGHWHFFLPPLTLPGCQGWGWAGPQ